MTSNPIILITGANTGLGFETIKSLLSSSKPYTILLGGRSPEKATSAVKEAEAAFPNSLSNLKAVQIDIEDDNSISELYELINAEYGRVDVLINNAGESQHGIFKS
jgi:NADP-dependent 3-hydroxy acid dehydrogenase YdfG